MSPATVYLWKKVPVIRLLLPLIGGILLQWYAQLPLPLLFSTGVFFLTGMVSYNFLSISKKWKLAPVNGCFISLLFIIAGAILIYKSDIRHTPSWIGNKSARKIVAVLQEPLVEKQASYKALATVKAYEVDHEVKGATGTVILYFKKDTAVQHLSYGSQIVFNKPLQGIKNSGNPGSFDYQQYSMFQGITHQVFLMPHDFVVLPQKKVNIFRQAIFQSRTSIIHILREFIPGNDESALAEALLIGYRDDLDKNIVQSYTNTGVVHIIAISGLHLGLIYWLLVLLTKPLKRRNGLNILRVLLIICSLWLFSILAGGQPSVLRSAVMFTCMALAEVFDRKTSVYNTLGLSAFLLLCYHPFWLWDVGFQLSYTAIISILLFFRPVYSRLYFPNKALDFIWKLNAVTIAAQVFTVPVSLYHFHQFPNLFLLTNLVAVPLSSLILISELLLYAFSFLPFMAKPVGMATSCFIKLMNGYIGRMNNVSFATWNGINISIGEVVVLIGFIAALSYWLLRKEKRSFIAALFCLLVFTLLRTADFIQASTQQKLIVYNVPKHQAIDIVSGRRYTFIGDSTLLFDDFFRNFHLQPSRILHRIAPVPTNNLSNSFQVHQKQIVIVDSTVSFKSSVSKPVVHVMVLSKNPKIYIPALYDAFTIEQVVIDASVPAWKARVWKRDCDSLHIPYHDVCEQGAFVLNL